jgi:hypothetical protein
MDSNFPGSPESDETIIKQSRLQWLWGKMPTINIFTKKSAKLQDGTIENPEEALSE